MSDTWESRMAERAKRSEEKPIPPMPTEEPECCAEWRWDGNWWLQFRTCEWGECDHEHHKDEIWFAAGAA